jgi:hypothetical protein
VRRAVRLGNGWMGLIISNVDFKPGGHHRAFDDATRPHDLPHLQRVYIAVDTDKSCAEERLRTWFGRRYRNADMASRVAVWGCE